MSNVYFQPATIDGSPRRAIVERVEKLMPDTLRAAWPELARVNVPICVNDDPATKWQPDTTWKYPQPIRRVNVIDEVMLRLTRLAVLEWMAFGAGVLEPGDGDPPISAEVRLVIENVYHRIQCVGRTDDLTNEFAHRLADALNIPH